MKKTIPNNLNRVDDVLRLQRGLYASCNPTRKWLHNSRLQWLTAAITRCFPAKCPGPAIDLGTGCGILLPPLSKRFEFVFSLDIEPELLHQLKNMPGVAENIQYLAADARCLPIHDNTVELIVCAEVLEHIDDDMSCLEEMYRVLKPGGVLILSTPQPFSLLELTAGILLRRPVIPLAKKIYREPVLPTGHINLISNHKLSDQLDRTGFAILETYKSGLYLPGLAEIPAVFPQKIAATINRRLTGTGLDFLLWTQFFVARKQGRRRSHTSQATQRI
jgi:ubiquinone/menaquinone biosynthesis C-methylase UbiE